MMTTTARRSATPHTSPTPRAEARELNAFGERALAGPVLVAVGLDDSADTPLRAAHERARAAGVPLVVCHVLPEPMRCEPQALQARTESYQELSGRIERVTSRTREEYTLVFPVGGVSSGILALAEALEPGLVVMGPGHTAVLVAIHERHDTLVVRPTPRGLVLGATDLTDPALPALGAAAREARQRERPLCLFHAVKPQRVPAPAFPSVLPVLPVTPSEAEALQAATVEAWQRLLDYSRDVLRGVPVDVQVVQGWPVKEIAQQTRRLPVELVVVATHARAGLAGLLRWSVTQELLACMPCSVLVVKQGEC